MRIFAILLTTSIFFMGYLILKKLKVNKTIYGLGILFIIYLMKDKLCIDYNYAVLFLALIIIYLEILPKKINDRIENVKDLIDPMVQRKRKHLLIGLIAGMCITLKQSTGFIIAIVTIGYPILFVRNKKDFINFIKIALMRTLGVMIPIIILLLYLIANQAILEFVDYCIMGIKTFTNYMPYLDLVKEGKTWIRILAVLVPVITIITFFVAVIKKDRNLSVLTAYSIATFAVVFPISDEIHFLIGSYISLLLIVYLINGLCKKLYQKEKERFQKVEFIKIFSETAILGVTILFVLLSIKNFVVYVEDMKKNPSIRHYYAIPMSEEYANMVEKVMQYIESEKELYILDSDAALYMIPLNRYHKNYDMLLKGNLGSEGEKGIIQNIKEMSENTKILIKNKKYHKNWQNPDQVTGYVEENWKKINEISYFDVYEK